MGETRLGRILDGVHRAQNIVVSLAVAVPLGGVGAWAFNPQSGAVLRSLVLWRICGVTFELGLPLLVVVTIVTAVVSVFRTRHPRVT